MKKFDLRAGIYVIIFFVFISFFVAKNSRAYWDGSSQYVKDTNITTTSGIQAQLTRLFFNFATSTYVDTITFYISGTIQYTGTWPKVCVDNGCTNCGTVHAAINNPTPTWETFMVNKTITSGWHELTLCVANDIFYYWGIAVNPFSTSTEVKWVDSGFTPQDEMPFFTVHEDYTGTVEIIDLPDWTGTVYVGADDYIVPVPYTKCIIGQTCRLWFNYGYDAVPGTAYLFASTTTEYLPEYSMDYVDLIMQTTLDDYFNIDDPAVPEVQTYKIQWINDDETDQKIYDNITVEWVEDSWEDLTPDYDNLCNDIATSSFEWWDPTSYAGAFRYAIECAARKTGYYFFVPSDTSRDYFDKSQQKLKGNFPFNTYFSLSDAVYEVLATTSTDMSSTLGIPFISATSSDFYILPVLSSSSIPNAIGEDNSDLLRVSLGWLLWIVTALIIIVLVYFSFF